MPEGDVVWRTADRLQAALAGQVVTACDLRWPSLATVDLSGRTVLEVLARGKHLLIRFDGHPAVTLHSHLRMEGSWHVHRTGERWDQARRGSGSAGSAGRQEHLRAVLSTASWTAVGHQLGMLDLVPTAGEGTLVGHLGPDLLGPDWDAEQVARTLRATPERPIAEALLDQRVLAGIGTMFMAESLFTQGINPWTPTGRVPDLPGLLARAQQMLRASTRRAVQSNTGDNRRGQRSWVHGRARQHCRRCGTMIRVAPVGVAPHDRVAFFCPRCQPPLPDHRAPEGYIRP